MNTLKRVHTNTKEIINPKSLGTQTTVMDEGYGYIDNSYKERKRIRCKGNGDENSKEFWYTENSDEESKDFMYIAQGKLRL